MQKFVNIAIFCVSLGVTSCALLFQGTTQEVAVMSDPSGATVTDNVGGTHQTPFTMTVPRNEDLQFHFSKAGYQSSDVIDNSQVEGGYLAADILVPIAWATDAATGAYFAHQQSVVTAHLDPLTPAASDSAPPAQKPRAQPTGTGEAAPSN